MTDPTEAPDHPFLLVEEADYPDLRERADRQPWRTWADRAEEQLEAPLEGASPREHSEAIIAKASGAALVSVLGRSSETDPADAVAEATAHFDEHLTPDLGNPEADNQWHFVVPPSGAFFTLVVALDVVRHDLDEATLRSVETQLAAAADWFHDEQHGSWKAARYGAYGVWAVYEGDDSRIEEAADRTLAAFEEEWPDGVYREGCEYANNRFAGHGIRNAKIHFPDVLDIAADVEFYGNESVRRDYAWLFGHSLTPIINGGTRDVYSFGDSGPGHTITSRSSCAYRAAAFGGAVENNAAWAITDEFRDANVFSTFVLTERIPEGGEPVGSRIFDGGGAWFLADSADPNAPAGALWCTTDASGHSHPDVNAVHLCANGEHVLRNAGYAGWGSGVDGFGWEYVHDRAVANNTVVLDYEIEADRNPPETDGHVARSGAGVREGFVGPPLGYACGDSGAAIEGARHRRSLVAVHPREDIGGYWVLFDEVDAAAAETVHTALHPGTGTAPAERVPGQEYVASIDRATRSEGAVNLSVLYGTQPRSVSVHEGLLADWDDSFVGRYLFATYPAGEGRQFATVLAPHGDASSAPEMHRIGAAGYSGARIDHGPAVDRAVEISADDRVSVGSASVAGRAALFRASNGSLEQYFVRRGTSFSHGEHGFEADGPVSISMAGTEGNVAADRRTEIEISHPDAAAISIGGADATASTTDGGVTATVPVGRHALSIE